MYTEYTFNRTTLELKRRIYQAWCWSRWSFNRTTLELKLRSSAPDNARIFAFNRTTLELKLTNFYHIIKNITLLIAPHWN